MDVTFLECTGANAQLISPQNGLPSLHRTCPFVSLARRYQKPQLLQRTIPRSANDLASVTLHLTDYRAPGKLIQSFLRPRFARKLSCCIPFGGTPINCVNILPHTELILFIIVNLGTPLRPNPIYNGSPLRVRQ